MNKIVLAVCTALIFAASPAMAANSDSLPTGPRSAFLNGIYLLAGSASIVMTDNGTVLGSVSGAGGEVFIMTVVDRSNGVDNAALTSLDLRLSDGTVAVINLPSQALVLMTSVGSCANRISEQYAYPNGRGGADSIELSYCPK